MLIFSYFAGKKIFFAIFVSIYFLSFHNFAISLKNIHYKCKASNEDILNAVSGVDCVDAQKERMEIIQNHIDYLDKAIQSVKKN